MPGIRLFFALKAGTLSAFLNAKADKESKIEMHRLPVCDKISPDCYSEVSYG